jgi:hypothetical protein
VITFELATIESILFRPSSERPCGNFRGNSLSTDVTEGNFIVTAAAVAAKSKSGNLKSEIEISSSSNNARQY